ncbi:MAG: hypothetical protein LUG51_14110 [Tannerellaceae bacterium]|nr:hypothetical protein [Tannerellaceae bacterium]
MRLQMIVISTISAALVLLFAGCRKQLKYFSFQYSIESPGNYKHTVSFKDDKSYRIETHNYLMDNLARRRAPIIVEGVMTDEEFKEAKKRVQDINFYKMKDSYGFDNGTEDQLPIIYQIYFSSKGKNKYISIKDAEWKELPQGFPRLVDFINTFVSSHKEK